MALKTALPSIEEQREMASERASRTRTEATPGIEPGKAAGRMQDKKYEMAREAMRNRHADTEIRPVSIINLLPIPLVVNSTMQDLKVRIEPCKRGEPFAWHTWFEPAIEANYTGEGGNMPYDFMPLTLARAFEKEYRDYGGVFILHGEPDEETLARPKVKAQFEEARAKMQKWMVSMMEKANGMWNTLNHVGQLGIGDIHRECAHYLFEVGVILALPPWVTTIRTPDQVAKACLRCGTVPALGASICIACQNVIDPAAAFTGGFITEEDASLERLTRAEVIDLGISAFVAETVDEKPDRLSGGLPKPKSLAQKNAEKAEERRQAEAAKKAAAKEDKPADTAK
jgi:hypothetical protein